MVMIIKIETPNLFPNLLGIRMNVKLSCDSKMEDDIIDRILSIVTIFVLNNNFRFCQEQREIILKERPGITHQELTKLIGTMWNALQEQSKEVWDCHFVLFFWKRCDVPPKILFQELIIKKYIVYSMYE